MLILKKFSANWCNPCKFFAPVVEETMLSFVGKIELEKIDIDKDPGMAKVYGVRTIPYLALVKDGKIVWSNAGVMSKTQLISILEKFV